MIEQDDSGSNVESDHWKVRVKVGVSLEALAIIQARRGAAWTVMGVVKVDAFWMYFEMESTEFADCLDMETEGEREGRGVWA